MRFHPIVVDPAEGDEKFSIVKVTLSSHSVMNRNPPTLTAFNPRGNLILTLRVLGKPFRLGNRVILSESTGIVLTYSAESGSSHSVLISE